VCDALDPFWLTIDDAWRMMTPETDEGLDAVDVLALIEAWLVDFAEVTDRAVVDLTRHRRRRPGPRHGGRSDDRRGTASGSVRCPVG